MGTLGVAFYTNAGSALQFGDKRPVNAISDLTDLVLTDQDGNKLKYSELENKVVSMNFFFTACGSACPTQTAVLRDIQESLDQSVDAVFVSVSIAPLNDTPDAIMQYIEKYQIKETNWRFVTASKANTEQLIKRYGVTLDNAVIEDDKLDHRNMGYLFGKNGVLMQQYQLVPGIGKRLVREITELATLNLSS